MKLKSFILLFIFGLFIFLLPSFAEAACQLACYDSSFVGYSCKWVHSTDWSDGLCSCGWERLGLIGSASYTNVPSTYYMCESGNCANSGTTYSNCKADAFPIGYDGATCTAIDGDWSFPNNCTECVKSGHWDASQSKCVECSGKKENRILGNTTSVGDVCNDNFPAGDGKCESACGANSACDEKSSFAYVAGCIACSSQDSGTHCQGFCSSDCQYSKVCQVACGAAAACGGSTPGASCGVGGTCDDSCQCVTPPQPDLIISANNYSPSSPIAGNSMTFSGTVKNQGGAQAVASKTRLRIDIDNNGTYDVLLTDQSTGVLNAGATETETWSNVWTAQAGTHKYEICADATALVTESNEGNNCVTQTFTVTTVPVFDFSISVSPASGSATQGGSTPPATVTITLTSGATQDVSFYILSGLPDGTTAFLNPTHCSPTCNSTMTVNTSTTTPVGGPYSISVCGTGGGQTHCVIYDLTVTAAGAVINPPSVTTNSATNITQTSATLNGTLNSMGNAASVLVWFEWGTTTSYGNSTPVQTMTSTGAFSANISGLSPNTIYDFVAKAKNGGSW